MTTYPASRGGNAGRATMPWLARLDVRVTGAVALVHPGRPVTVGPARCQGCRSLVWWSGALWTNEDGTWHRCSFITPLDAAGPEGTIGP